MTGPVGRRRPLMVLGCTSSAGKSLVATALCRAFARRGIDVAPFKAQNMSNNARVVEGGEIGVAQWLQAAAARVEPTVDVNPVLLKPEADTRSQVVVHGVARPELADVPWRDRGPHLWPAMVASYERLAADHELVVIEGAGSPAEINLPDLVNNRVLAHADAAAVLVADIDRGGAFAHLYGTWALTADTTRERLVGFVLNRFRGDASLLAPGPERIAERTGMADLGVLPMLDHQLPDEEGGSVRARPPAGARTVAVVRYPYASNLDELHLLPHAARVRWATAAGDLDGADLVVLPGSKHVAADRAWLDEVGLADDLVGRARGGGPILGVCGGAMLLGGAVRDPAGIEGSTHGLDLLPLTTEMRPQKLTARTTVAFPTLPAPWAGLSRQTATGYEIRNGSVQGGGCAVADLVWVDGPVLATTVHGLLEDPAVLAALLGTHVEPILEATFEQLADAVEAHLDVDRLVAATAPGPGPSPQ